MQVQIYRRRPAYVIGNAVRVMKIATGKFVEDVTETEKENARKVD